MKEILGDYNVKMHIILKKLFDHNKSRLSNLNPLRLQNAMDSKKVFDDTIKELESYAKQHAIDFHLHNVEVGNDPDIRAFYNNVYDEWKLNNKQP